MLQPLAKVLETYTVFWLKWSVHDLVLVTPPPPLFKVASNTRPCSKLGGTTLNGGRRGVSILSHRPVTSSDLKQDRLFFCESVSTFLQLVVAFNTPTIFFLEFLILAMMYTQLARDIMCGNPFYFLILNHHISVSIRKSAKCGHYTRAEQECCIVTD